jgi:hypothetical protein
LSARTPAARAAAIALGAAVTVLAACRVGEPVGDVGRATEDMKAPTAGLAAAPQLSSCPNGVNVIIVMPQWVDDHVWMMREAGGVLDELAEAQGGTTPSTVRVGVVRYDHLGNNGVTLELTADIERARGQIQARPVSDCTDAETGGCACIALIQALRLAAPHAVDLAAAAHGAAPTPTGSAACDLVVLFAEGVTHQCGGYPMAPYSEWTVLGGQELRAIGPVLVGCPSAAAENCSAPRQIADDGGLYFEPPALGEMRSAIRAELAKRGVGSGLAR